MSADGSLQRQKTHNNSVIQLLHPCRIVPVTTLPSGTDNGVISFNYFAMKGIKASYMTWRTKIDYRPVWRITPS